MTDKTMLRLQSALEAARKEGYAVIGFAVKPDENGMVQLNNQDMTREQFVAMTQTALTMFAGYTTDKKVVQEA